MPPLKRFVQAVLSAFEFHFLRYSREWVLAAVLLIFAAFGWQIFFAAPSGFVPGTVVLIPRGAAAPQVAMQLSEAHIVRNPALLKDLLRVTGAGGRIQAGPYRFGEADNLFRVAYRLATGEYGIPPARVTFTEGMTVREMALRITSTSLAISMPDFISAGQPYEGYLFPDTYTFTPAADAKEVVAALHANFTARTAPLTPDIAASGHSLSDIITMASLIEKEAGSVQDMQVISGILWSRIRRGMPLQVDAVFGYIYGRSTYSPSFSDLAVDSPYNTYTHKGLPPGPIGNPGLASIGAALHPAKTNALYYITGKDGNLYTATTYAGQLANQRKYLR